ncbi:MAG: glycoside hydrolase family 25 protein, partial [Candidatus Aenigmarchaeota archaeon]|nr:glycoside hydrolase family 25 protein [Candidatus Aenigmarchaeota archaeon]
MSTGVSAAGFGIGDTVEVYNTGTQGLVVRGPNACDGQIGGKFDGDRGVVLAGPVYCNSYNRWKIRWSDSLEGWSAEDWLRKVSITPSTKFSIGNRVKVNANGVNVRGDTPELAVLGSVNYGDQGTVIAGPFYGVPKGSSGFYYFWKIDYDTKTDGWTAENYLDKDSCTNECSSGQTRCNENYQQTCGNYDADSCTEWPSSTSGTGNDNCNDCSCSCGGYNTAEAAANGNCNDGEDDDCDGYTDGADSGCAGAQYIDGIDVSGWQHQAGDINWSQVYNEGYRFAFVKATQRDSYTNPYFKSDMDSGRNARLLVGAYHFGCPSYNPNQYCYGTSAEVEAQYFLDVAGNYLIQGYLRPVLDIDQPICDDFYNTGNCLGLRNWIDKWMDIIKTKNVTPILYTGPYCIRDCLGSSFAKKYDLWIARYGSSPCPFSSCDWDWAFWQYSETGTVPGINGYVDLDKFNGDMARLNTFLISGSNQPPNIPTSLSQRRSDNITVIPEGGTTPESTVVFKGTVNDPDGDNVRLEIELRQIGEAFTGTPTTETISGF